jgi:hypothetical protein
MVNDRPNLSSERMFVRNITASVQLKKLLVVSVKGPVVKTN